MKHGNKILLAFLFFFLKTPVSFSEERISTSPLLNLEKIKPSFEELEVEKENFTIKKNLKEKKKSNKNSLISHAVIIGLDKITAKSSKIYINLDETNTTHVDNQDQIEPSIKPSTFEDNSNQSTDKDLEIEIDLDFDFDSLTAELDDLLIETINDTEEEAVKSEQIKEEIDFTRRPETLSIEEFAKLLG